MSESQPRIHLPACGIFVGSGVYEHGGRPICSGKAFTHWAPDGPSARETIDLCVEVNQGNTLQFWQNGERLLEVARAAGDQLAPDGDPS